MAPTESTAEIELTLFYVCLIILIKYEKIADEL